MALVVEFTNDHCGVSNKKLFHQDVFGKKQKKRNFIKPVQKKKQLW
jgi:hypothetical protein